jgi:dienelactone hydrolase
MNIEQVSFPSGPVHCAGDLYLPDAAGNGTPVPGIVMGHSVIMVKEALRPHADYLVRAGFAVLAIDYRTIGSSEGEPRCQWFPERQVEDMRAGVSYLAARAEVDPGRIGAWGHSTAAGVAIVAGALDRRITCVACQNPSMLDGWTALEKTQGRTQMGKVRALLQQDFERRLHRSTRRYREPSTWLPRRRHGACTAAGLPGSRSAVAQRRLGASRPAAMRTQETRLAGQDSGVGAVWPPAAPCMVDT